MNNIISRVIPGVIIKGNDNRIIIKDYRVYSLKQYILEQSYGMFLEDILRSLGLLKEEPKQPFLYSHIINGEKSYIVDSRGIPFILKKKRINNKMHMIDDNIEKILENIPFMPTLLVVDFGYKCNLNCLYCSRKASVYSQFPPKITSKTLRKSCELISILYKFLDVPVRIQPYGGEPLLYFEEIKELIKSLKRLGVEYEISIQTNGTLITPKIAEDLYEIAKGIGISIDGPKDIHNITRGFFDKVIEGYENLLSAGFRRDSIGVICVITKYNYRFIDDILNFFIKEMRVTSVSFLLGVKTDKFTDVITPKEWAHILIKLVDFYLQNDNILLLPVEEMVACIINGYSGSTCYNSLGCMGGFGMLAVSTDGKIYPCPELIGYTKPFCNIVELIESDNPIQFIIRKSLLWKESILRNSKMLYPIVGHGCPLKNIIYEGQVSRINPYDKIVAQEVFPVLLKKLLEEI